VRPAGTGTYNSYPGAAFIPKVIKFAFDSELKQEVITLVTPGIIITPGT